MSKATCAATAATAKRAKKPECPEAKGQHWLDDPRLPDESCSVYRVHGAGRPTQSPPYQAPTVAELRIPSARNRAEQVLKVQTNRTGKRWWFVAVVPGSGPRRDPVTGAMPWAATSYMLDYASTTSAKVAQGWIDALTRKRRTR